MFLRFTMNIRLIHSLCIFILNFRHLKLADILSVSSDHKCTIDQSKYAKRIWRLWQKYLKHHCSSFSRIWKIYLLFKNWAEGYVIKFSLTLKVNWRRVLIPTISLIIVQKRLCKWSFLLKSKTALSIILLPIRYILLNSQLDKA